MAIENSDPGRSSQESDKDDGLYPGLEGDLGKGQGGDTEPMPGTNDPLVPGAEPDSGNPDWERNDRVNDPDLPIEPAPIDEDEELTLGNKL